MMCFSFILDYSMGLKRNNIETIYSPYWKIYVFVAFRYPLVFYMTRYEILFNFLDLNTAGTNILPSSLGQAFFIMFVNSDIQMIGIFFALSFLTVSLKLKGQLRKNMIVTVIGMILLFASRDLHSVFVHSFPPGGVVTISFMAVGSYMLFTGLISFLISPPEIKSFTQT